MKISLSLLKAWKIQRTPIDTLEKVYQYAPERILNVSRHTYIWGFALSGALGNPEFLEPGIGNERIEYVESPKGFKFFYDYHVKDIACGVGFTVIAVKSAKDSPMLFGTGVNTSSQIGYHVDKKNEPFSIIIKPLSIELPIEVGHVTNVSCGRAHTLCLTDNNTVLSLGNNSFGQCGRPIVEKENYFGSQKVNIIKEIEGDIAQIVCGQDHSLFLTKQGNVYSCGWGADGQTGLGHCKNVDIPTLVKGDIEKEKIVQISTSIDSTLALNDKGDIFGWGNTEYSQFGLVTEQTFLNIPRHIPFSYGRVKCVAASGSMCGVVNEKGDVYVWGFGILGKGPKIDYEKNPSLIPGPLFGCNECNPNVKVESLNAGHSYWAAITNRHDLYTWGKNRGHCLGLNINRDQYFPKRVNIPGYVTKVSLGFDHCAALARSLI